MQIQSLPTNGVTTVKSGKNAYGMVKREAQTRFVLGQTASGEEVVVDVTTRHDPDSKVWRASATWGKASTDGPFSVFTWGSDHRMVQLVRMRCERYSKKGLVEMHEKVIAGCTAGFETVAPVFEQAAEQVEEATV